MPWYRAGTVSVTNGSAVITGANNDFVSNTQQGEIFLGPDGRVYEIASVVSAAQIILASTYQGATAGGQGFAIAPTSSFARDLALGVAQMINRYAGIADGVGAGLFPDGTVALPAVRFAADQDTGIIRSAPNQLGFVAGGGQRVTVSPAGLSVLEVIEVASGAGVAPRLLFGSSVSFWSIGCPVDTNALVFVERQFASEKMRIDGAGNLLVGVTAGSEHALTKNVAQGTSVLKVQTSGSGGLPSMVVAGVVGYTPSGSGAAVYVGHNTATSRSINASGTVNASGADYAEYMRKAEGCGTIAKGDVCGVDREGFLTRTWAAAVSYVVKSTDPSLVGGDIWAGHLGPKPEPVGTEPISPGDAPAMPEADDPDALAAWREAVAAHTALIAAYPDAHARWASDQAAYQAALAAWETDLETARQCVDRIAFCGQVPVNVASDFAVGDYIVAVANGSGIKAVAVTEADITFDQYRRRLGKVWTVRDGRAWIDVQHG